MLRLTREVRFSLIDGCAEASDLPGANSFGGNPAHRGWGQFLRVAVTLSGQPHPHSSYVCNISEIDAVVRQRLIPAFRSLQASSTGALPKLNRLMPLAFELLTDAWPGQPGHTAQLE
ncbi:MAG: hypothetical protein RMJ35_12140, partial [Phycisphaerales bacterium]|nr:hypothetical protein [Phycisphaerales bacterium]